jgi:hypothetical protein
MVWDRELEDFQTTTVTWSTQASMTLSGAQSFSTATYTIKARIEHETKLVRDTYGKEVVSVTQVYLKPVSTTGATYAKPSITGQITLPSGNTPQTPPVINVLRLDDAISEGGGVHHYEVQL